MIFWRSEKRDKFVAIGYPTKWTQGMEDRGTEFIK